MVDGQPVVVDARGGGPEGLPQRPGLPPREAEPRLLRSLASRSITPSGDPGPRFRSLRQAPVAGLPQVVAGTRTERRTLLVYHVIDMSPSNAWNDPQGARHLDFAYLARGWAKRVIPDDIFVPVLFDRTANIYSECRPRDVPRDGWKDRPAPNPELGGTRFLPPAHAVARHAAQHPHHAKLAIYYSDGMPSDENDIAQASAVLVAADVPGVLIPYGMDFPWISAHWRHTAFRIAEHPSDRRRGIAQTAALAILSATGHQRRR